MRFFSGIQTRWNAPQGYGDILRVGLPLVASMSSSAIMQFTDRLFLSRYSVDAIAAALPAATAQLTIMLTLMGLCGYSSVLIAQYVGSRAPERVGPALWQGIWCALLGGCVMACMWWAAEPLFAFAGHDPGVRELEIDYFRVLCLGSGFALLGASVGGFYVGRGQTRPVLVANMIAAVVNVPLDYLLIFGGFGIPPLGVIGAGAATVFGWFLAVVIVSVLVFTRKHEVVFKVRSSWRLEWDMLRRLLRYGLPSGVNFFVEMVAVTWFVFEVGSLGTNALAASNIAFSMNSLCFMPMLGLNMAVSALVGQAMGRGRPLEAERVTKHTLHLALAYMLPVALLFVLIPGQLMDLFAPGEMTPEQFAPVRAVGITLLMYIAVYSLVDAGNIVFFGALKGAGDTLGVMFLLVGGLVFFLALPILAMKHLGVASLHGYWLAFTAYVIALAIAACARFYMRRWHRIRVVETARSDMDDSAA